MLKIWDDKQDPKHFNIITKNPSINTEESNKKATEQSKSEFPFQIELAEIKAQNNRFYST